MPASSRHHRHDLPERAHGVFLSSCVNQLCCSPYTAVHMLLLALEIRATGVDVCLQHAHTCQVASREKFVQDVSWSLCTHARCTVLREAGDRGQRPSTSSTGTTGLLVGEKTTMCPNMYGTRIVGDRTFRLKTCTVQSARSTYLNHRFRYVLGQAGD